MRKRRIKLFGAEARNWMDARRDESEALRRIRKPRKSKAPKQLVAEAQRKLDRRWPDAWAVTWLAREQGFRLVRADIVEMMEIGDFVDLAELFPRHRLYVTFVTDIAVEDHPIGARLAVWLTPRNRIGKR